MCLHLKVVNTFEEKQRKFDFSDKLSQSANQQRNFDIRKILNLFMKSPLNKKIENTYFASYILIIKICES